MKVGYDAFFIACKLADRNRTDNLKVDYGHGNGFVDEVPEAGEAWVVQGTCCVGEHYDLVQ